MLRFKVFGLIGVAILMGLAAFPGPIQAVTSVIDSTIDDGNSLQLTQDTGAVVEPVVQVTTDPAYDDFPSLLEAADGRLWAVWSRNCDLWVNTSNDGGLNWSTSSQVTTSGSCVYGADMAQTADGRLWIVFHYTPSGSNDIGYVTSDDNGASWSATIRLTTDPMDDIWPSITQDSNGRIWVAWTSTRTGSEDIFYKTSDDGGLSWSPDTQLSNGPGSEGSPDIIELDDGRVWVVWRTCSHCEVVYASTADGGTTWSPVQQLTSNSINDESPSIAQTSDGRIWVAWYSWNNANPPSVYNSDIWYITSDDGGATWSDETKFTQYLGNDYYPEIADVDSGESLGLVWYSDRTGNGDIWFGIVGALEDLNPPPIVLSLTHDPQPNPDADDIATITTSVVDEIGIAGVELVWSIDGSPQTNLAMFDDGTHGDETPEDGLYTVEIGPFATGNVVEYQILATDIDGIDALWPPFPFSFEVLPPFIPETNTLLVVDSTYAGDVNFIAPFYKEALNETGVDFDFWDTSERGAVDVDILNAYLEGVVIWSKPYWSGVLNDSEAQQNLGAYLDAGGKLFVTGQGIADRLNGTDFLRDYLHASFVQYDTELFALDGVDGDPISDGLHLEISGNGGAGNQSSTDEIAVFFPGIPVLYYDETATVPLAQSQRPERASSRTQAPPLHSGDGLASELNEGPSEVISSGVGGLRVDTGTYKVVFFSFGLEGINSLADRVQTMKRVLTWLNPSITFCTLEIDLSYAEGTLSMDFEIGTTQPANWDLWLVVPGVGIIPVWSIPLPVIDPLMFPSLSFAFPNLANVGFLTTLSTPEKRIICYDFDVVDTGTPSSTATPSADELRRFLPKPVGALSNN